MCDCIVLSHCSGMVCFAEMKSWKSLLSNQLQDEATSHWERLGEYAYKQVLRVQEAAHVLRRTSHHKTEGGLFFCVILARPWLPIVLSNTRLDDTVTVYCRCDQHLQSVDFN